MTVWEWLFYDVFSGYAAERFLSQKTEKVFNATLTDIVKYLESEEQ